MATRKSNPKATAPTESMPLHAIAKALNMTSRELRDAILALNVGWDVSNHMKKLTAEQIIELERRINVRVLPPNDLARKHFAAREAAAAEPAQAAAPAPDADAGAEAEAATEAKPRRTRKPRATAAQEAEAAVPEAAPEAAAAPDESADDAPAGRSRGRRGGKGRAATETVEVPAAEILAQQADQQVAATADDAPAPAAPARKAPAEPAEPPRDYIGEGKEFLVVTLQQLGFKWPRIQAREADGRMEFIIGGQGTEALLGSANAAARTDVIESLQLLLGKHLFGSTERAKTVILDVQGFRAARVDQLAGAAARLAEYVRTTGRRVRLASTNSFDRRAFHAGLQTEEGVRSESFGYGIHRRLEIFSPRRRRDDDRRRDSDDTNADVATTDAPTGEGVEAAPEANQRPRRERRPRRDEAPEAAAQNADVTADVAAAEDGAEQAAEGIVVDALEQQLEGDRPARSRSRSRRAPRVTADHPVADGRRESTADHPAVSARDTQETAAVPDSAVTSGADQATDGDDSSDENGDGTRRRRRRRRGGRNRNNGDDGGGEDGGGQDGGGQDGGGDAGSDD